MIRICPLLMWKYVFVCLFVLLQPLGSHSNLISAPDHLGRVNNEILRKDLKKERFFSKTKIVNFCHNCLPCLIWMNSCVFEYKIICWTVPWIQGKVLWLYFFCHWRNCRIFLWQAPLFNPALPCHGQLDGVGGRHQIEFLALLSLLTTFNQEAQK